jgi:hypothetical protein
MQYVQMTAIHRRSSGRTLLVFLLFGPPIGGVALGLSFLVSDILDGGYIGWGVLTSLPVMAIVAYMFGVLPAFFTGVMAIGLSDRFRSDLWWLFAVTAIGATSSGVFYIFLSPQASLRTGLVGAVAALGSAILALAVRPLPDVITPEHS